MSAFDGKNEGIGIHVVNQVLQLPQFQSGDDGKNDVTIGADFEFSRKKTPLAFVNGNSSSEIVHQFVFDLFAFAGDDGHTGKCLNTFHYIINASRCSKIGQNGIKGRFDPELKGSDRKDQYIDSQDDLRDSEGGSF